MKLKIAALGAKGIPHPGGIELVMEEIGSRLVDRGHQFDIFVRCHYMVEKRIQSYKNMGLPRSPGLHNKHLDALSHSFSALPAILANGYNIVYLNSVGLAPIASIPRAAGLKVVVHTHGLDWKREKWGPIAKILIRKSAWAAVNLPHVTFCVCEEDKRFLEGIYGKPCVLIPNGIPDVVEHQPDLIGKWGLRGLDYVLFLGRLVPEKGAHLLLQAWSTIPKAVKKGKKLVIAGDTNHRDSYYHSLMSYDRLDDVVFTGFATGQLKQELLTNTLCLIQPSTIEGMSMSLLEAMGYGRMILASDIQENKDVLSCYGRTFRLGNVEDLSSKTTEILSMGLESLALEGNKLSAFGMANYNWDKILDKVETTLINLIKN